MGHMVDMDRGRSNEGTKEVEGFLSLKLRVSI